MENNTDPAAAETARKKDSPEVDPSTSCSASFGERLTAAIALRQTEIGPEAKRIQGIFGMDDCPERRQWVKEAVNQLTAGLGLCFLADLTMEEMLEPWVAAMERQNPELNETSAATGSERNDHE